jgi:hypothetical protein
VGAKARCARRESNVSWDTGFGWPRNHTSLRRQKAPDRPAGLKARGGSNHPDSKSGSRIEWGNMPSEGRTAGCRLDPSKSPATHLPTKVLALAGSTSSTSINCQLANFAAGLVTGAEVTELDLRGNDFPMYSSDEEASNGIPKAATDLIALVLAHDAIVISLAERNGSYAAAFKNI